MQLLTAPTEPFVRGERTQLADAASAGSDVALAIENTAGFAVDQFVAIGHEGSELAELQRITAVGSGTATVGTLKFNHAKGTPIVHYRFNQRKFYGTTTADGDYTELTADGSPKDDPIGTRSSTPRWRAAIRPLVSGWLTMTGTQAGT